jgi:hypothetical protein
VLGCEQSQLWKMLVAQNIENKARKNQRGQNGGCVEDAAQALPTLSLGVEENLAIGHE